MTVDRDERPGHRLWSNGATAGARRPCPRRRRRSPITAWATSSSDWTDLRIRAPRSCGRRIWPAGSGPIAELLVVRRHHHAGLSELALGSVPRTCAQHARCPVVVVPSEASAEPGDGAPDRTTGDRQVGHSALPGPGGGTKN
ncbi:MAG TPA: universal stress protein [Pseudonocardia sp.]|nr:universal stress protein [Pseudonocardia sp.]